MDKKFFVNPRDSMQRRYEALRSYFVDGMKVKDIAKSYNYSIDTVYYLLKHRKELRFFLPLKAGPSGHRKQIDDIKQEIISLRKRNYSIYEIEETLRHQGHEVTCKTIHIILKEDGFGKLFRRTNVERLETLQSRRKYPEEADVTRFACVSPVLTSYGGLFLFIPIILELGLDKILKENLFYGSKQIPRINYLLSYLILKLLGRERLCHINDFSFDYGIGTFAGLNVLPKCAAITQYSYRNRNSLIKDFVNKFLKILQKKKIVTGKCINLDFHTMPHYGDESHLQNNWIPVRSKSMKSVLSFFAQDLDTTYLCYSNADILREEAKDEVLRFIEFYKKNSGRYPECLVFDSKLTTYENLNILNGEKHIKFITLRRRGKSLNKKISEIREWKKIKLDNVKRKYRNVMVHNKLVNLSNYDGKIRQIVVTGTGRELPMVLLTNDIESSEKEILTRYTHRWRIELNIGENVDFFNLNALSSPVVVKVNFDIAVTLIANTLYKLLAKEIRRFEKAKAKNIFRNFIGCQANIYIDTEFITVKFEKKSYNPLVMDWIKDRQNIVVPWMGNRKLRFDFW